MLETIYLQIENWINNSKKRRKIKRLKKELNSLSWIIGVEKNNSKELSAKYEKKRTELKLLEFTTW
jgi:hypothetical protein